MRSTITVVLVGVVCAVAAGQDYTQIHDSGPHTNRVNMVFLGDGYTAGEIGTAYAQHVNNVLDAMFGGTEPPYHRYQNYYNAYRVNIVSNESGIDHPLADPPVEKDTALGAFYGIYGLIMVDGTATNAAFDAFAADSGVESDIRLIAANDSEYGGAGASYWATYAGGHPDTKYLALHEMAHMFSPIGDEYQYNNDTTYTGEEPHFINLTKDPTGTKWAHWIGYTDPDTGQTVGVYEGGNYSDFGVYRPTENGCKMRTNKAIMCPVCREQIILDIYAAVDPLDAAMDNSVPLTDPTEIWVDCIDPTVIKLQWFADGVLLDGITSESIDPMALGLPAGPHTISCRAYDDTEWVRRDLDHLEQTVNWDVTLTVPEPGSLALLSLGSFAMLRRRRQQS